MRIVGSFGGCASAALGGLASAGVAGAAVPCWLFRALNALPLV